MLGFTLTQRDLRPERMDQPDLDPPRHEAALRGLERINRMSGTARRLWRRLAPDVRNTTRPLHILDVATGAGDVPAALARYARAEGRTLRIIACDISPRAVEHAMRRHGQWATFRVADALRDELPTVDVALSCLFLHHLEPEAAVHLLRRMRQVASRVIIDDLERSSLGWLLAWAGTRVLSRSEVVHDDGPQSVRAAFTGREVRVLAEQAGLAGAVVQRHWPFRLTLDWRRA